MHSRYPAPEAERIFADQAKIDRWRHLTDLYARASIIELEVGEHEALTDWFTSLEAYPTPTPEAVKTREATTGHDVVAFLSLYTQTMPDVLKRHIHRGLTSSDLVEYSHHAAMYYHGRVMADKIDDLVETFRRWEGVNTLRAGRTHGQIASATTWGNQLGVQFDTFRLIERQIRDICAHILIKTPGPVGVSGNMRGRLDRVRSWSPGHVTVRSTQVIPRDRQMEWAAMYLRLAGALENLALQVRLGSRSEVGELREGATANRVGSSAMPHKKNPIDSEKVCGLARVARGYFATIAEGAALWEDRDLTNSSMERIAVPDLAAVVEHMIDTMIKIMTNLEFHPQPNHLVNSAVWSNLFQTTLQEVARIGPIEASQIVRELAPKENMHVNFVKQRLYNWLKDNRDDHAAGFFLHRVDPILDDAFR